MRSLTVIALALVALTAGTGCDTDYDCPMQEAPVVENVSTTTESEEPVMPDGLHFAKVTCHGACIVNVKREDGSNVWRWYIDEGAVKNDGRTTLDDLIVKHEVVYFTLTKGAKIELELIQPPSDFTDEPVMVLESTSAWYTFGYYAWTKDGPKWRDSAFAGISGTSVGVVFDYTVMN